MKEQTRLALGSLAGLGFYPKQEAELDEACEYDSRAFAQLVGYAETAENPGGALVVGARKIISNTRALEAVRGQMVGDRAVKRARAALSYARSALGLIPPVEQEDDLRMMYPELPAEALHECLALGFEAWRLQEADQLALLQEGQARRRGGTA